MEPLKDLPGGFTSISLKDEIDMIRKRLEEMGETSTETAASFQSIPEGPQIAKHKIKRAKDRKKKRKNGGPR